jgi:hypothetical protein
MDVQEEKKGFSWMALLFAPYYYSGYGKLKKGLIMAVIGFIPLTAIFVNIYGGFRAKKELPIGKQDFKWGPAIGVFFLHWIITAVVFSFSPQFQEEMETSMLSDVSGVWRADSDGAMVTINLSDESQHVIINENQIPVKVDTIDSDNHVVSLKINANNQIVIWTIQKVFETEDRFHLKLTLHEGSQDELSFVRNLK